VCTCGLTIGSPRTLSYSARATSRVLGSQGNNRSGCINIVECRFTSSGGQAQEQEYTLRGNVRSPILWLSRDQARPGYPFPYMIEEGPEKLHLLEESSA